MRLTIVLLIASLVQVSASSFGQKITLTQENVPLKTLFKEFRKQSGYNFLYDGRIVTPEVKASIRVKDATIQEAMATVLADLPYTFEIRDKMVIVTKKAEPPVLVWSTALLQGIEVKGKVVDSLGTGLAGATVLVKGSKQTTSTNAGGEFVLKNVDEEAILTISYLGYITREVSVNKEFNYIELQQSLSKLDEVQIQAYSKTSNRLSVGSITTVKADDIQKQPLDNPLLALAGRVPGLIVTQTNGMPGAAVNLQLRGNNSLSFTTSPLIVIDGVPTQNEIPGLGNVNISALSSFGFINSNDIESISVLKDADATSIYGSRGANGVILITTKKGQIGKAKIDITLQNGWANVASNADLMNTEEFLGFRKDAFKNDGIDFINKYPFDIGPSSRFSVAPDLFYYAQDSYTDWQKMFAGNTGLYNDFQGSVSGGNTAVQYRVGANYHRQTYVFPGSTGDQKGTFTSSINGSSQDQKFKIGINSSYTISRSKLPGVNFSEFMLFAPNYPALINADGSFNWVDLPLDDGTTIYGFRNPFAAALNESVSDIRNLSSSGNINYTPLDGLSLNVNVGFSRLEGRGFNPYYMASQNLPFWEAYNLVPPASFSDRDNVVKSFNIDPNVKYTFKKGHHDFLVILGATYSTQSTSSLNTSYEGYINDAFIPNVAAASRINAVFSGNEYFYGGVFGRIEYNFKDKYLLNFNGRRDGSSRFGPGKQFGNFGSAGLAWIFSEESLIKNNLAFLSFGKIRTTWGTAGNDGVGDYQYLNTYRINSGTDNTYQGAIGLITNGLTNPDFHWEVTRKLEFGLDLGLFKNKFLLNFNYYRNRSGNQLMSQKLPLTSGVTSLVVNSPALLQNAGTELVLTTKNIETKFFNWESALTLGRNSNKLISFPGLEQSVYSHFFAIGEPTGNIRRVYKSAGVDPATGIYQFQKSDGSISSDNPGDPLLPFGGRYVNINLNPSIDGMLTNMFSYKNIRLSFDFQFRKTKGYSPYGNYYSGLGTSTNNLPRIYLNYWKQPGDITPLGRISGTYDGALPDMDKARAAQDYFGQSDAMFTDASFVRLRNVSISYSLSSRLMERLHLGSTRIFLNAANLLTFTSYKGWDPEIQSYTTIPPLRVITAGLQFTL